GPVRRSTALPMPALSIDLRRCSPKSYSRPITCLRTFGSTSATVARQYSSKPGQRKCSSSAILFTIGSHPRLASLRGARQRDEAISTTRQAAGDCFASLARTSSHLYCILSALYHDASKRRKATTCKHVAVRMRQAEKTQTQIQVIARAGAILRALENESAGLSLGQIAQRVHLARSTVQRIVAALAAEKLVIAASPMGRVRLGPAILRLAASVQTDFVAPVRPFLVQLSHELHETVDLATVKHDHLVFIDQVIGSQRLRTVSAVGESFPLSCTANGKAYLAELD